LRYRGVAAGLMSHSTGEAIVGRHYHYQVVACHHQAAGGGISTPIITRRSPLPPATTSCYQVFGQLTTGA